MSFNRERMCCGVFMEERGRERETCVCAQFYECVLLLLLLLIFPNLHIKETIRISQSSVHSFTIERGTHIPQIIDSNNTYACTKKQIIIRNKSLNDRYRPELKENCKVSNNSRSVGSFHIVVPNKERFSKRKKIAHPTCMNSIIVFMFKI